MISSSTNVLPVIQVRSNPMRKDKLRVRVIAVYSQESPRPSSVRSTVSGTTGGTIDFLDGSTPNDAIIIIGAKMGVPQAVHKPDSFFSRFRFR